MKKTMTLAALAVFAFASTGLAESKRIKTDRDYIFESTGQREDGCTQFDGPSEVVVSDDNGDNYAVFTGFRSFFICENGRSYKLKLSGGFKGTNTKNYRVTVGFKANVYDSRSGRVGSAISLSPKAKTKCGSRPQRMEALRGNASKVQFKKGVRLKLSASGKAYKC